jgi:hypothetical protein
MQDFKTKMAMNTQLKVLNKKYYDNIYFTVAGKSQLLLCAQIY